MRARLLGPWPIWHGSWARLSLARDMGVRGILRGSVYVMAGLLFFRPFFAFAKEILIFI